MMRHWNVNQENIHQHYFNLGKSYVESSAELHNNGIGNSNIWKIITKEGIWKLPISKLYGGMELSWDESIIAIEGLIGSYPNDELFSALVSHLSALYLITKYGTKTQKLLYLPRLIQGNISSILIPAKKIINNQLTINIVKNKIITII